MEPAASAKTPSLAWKWILERLLDMRGLGLPFFDGLISSHISDIEEPHCEPLLKRVALRVLEEMIVRDQIDSGTIPLLKKINGENLHSRSIGLSIKQRFHKELVLRVQTEVVLSVLRKDLDEGAKDWSLYESKLESVFGEAVEDNRLLDRKSELRALLEPKNQTKDIVTAYFRKFSLSKLRLDLRSFIDEKRETLDTMFLDQLSRAFLDANGKPFSEDLGGVEKSKNVEANEKLQDHGVFVKCVEGLQELEERSYGQYNLGQNQKRSLIEDQHMVPGISMVSGKKRRRWEHLSCTQNAIGDDESEEADEGLAGMKKSRKSPAATPHIVNPLLRHCVSELAVAQKLSTHGKVDRLIEKGNGDNYNKRGAQSFSKNGSDRGHPQGIMETEFIRETIILQRGRKILMDRRSTEASTGSPEVIVLDEEDNERFVTMDELRPPDSQDVNNVDSLEVDGDGDEEICHMCGKPGKLLWCDGCPMCMHFDCIKVLGLRLPKSKEWLCPNCLLLKAEREAAEAEKVAAAAKNKLQVLKTESKKMRISPLRHSRQESGIRQSSLRIGSPQSEESDRFSNPNQDSSDEEPILGYTEGQHFNFTGPASPEAYLRNGRCKIPGLRRTPLPWTREEEEVLKKGVYLSRNGAFGGSRWIRILELGQGIFDPSRTSVDVKDKWRNLVKRANAS